MIIKFDLDSSHHMKEISSYNNNYYKLDYSINGCNVVYQEWKDDMSEGNYYLGNIDSKNQFIAMFEFYGDNEGVVNLNNNYTVI